MVSMPVRLVSAPHGHDDMRSEAPNRPHHVAQDLFSSPLAESFCRTVGETKIERSREELLHSVIFAGRHHLAGANETERLKKIWSDKILATLAPCQGQQGCSSMQAATHVRQHARVFIVGMGRHKHHARRIGQPVESL